MGWEIDPTSYSINFCETSLFPQPGTGLMARGENTSQIAATSDKHLEIPERQILP
jgi:hypothetical protein